MNAAIKHPLEPLTAHEVALAVTLLKDAGKVTPTTRFVSVGFKEPAKELLYAFNSEPDRSSQRQPCDTGVGAKTPVLHWFLGKLGLRFWVL